MILSVLFQVILANMGMFLLLRTFGIKKITAFLISLAYGYMTFLMLRLGHLTYYSIYVFPWFYYCLLQLINKTSKTQKFIYSFATAIVLVLAFYHNLYYFIMLCLASSLLLVYLFVFHRRQLIKITIKNIYWLLLVIFLTFILVIPWLLILIDTYRFEGLPRTEGWGGAIKFSADLFGMFIPSSYGYFSGRYGELLQSSFTFASGIFENFTYPGLIILLTYLGGLILLIKKTIKRKDLTIIGPYIFTGLSFWTLTLGPFLQVFGRWHIPLDEEIKLIIPLPYIILHYIPLLNNIRSPGRLVVCFIFFSYIITAFVVDLYLKNKKTLFKTLFYSIIVLLFIFDHYFKYPTPPSYYYPNKIYQIINNDKNENTVMEAPSVIRDGFTYFGDEGGFNFFVGQLKYKKPVLAGYFGRVPTFKRNYYINNPALGYFGRLMDENISTNGSIDKSDLLNWQQLDIKKAKESLDFLDVAYYIVDNDKLYSASISANLVNLDFNKVMDERNFSLWKREINQKEFLTVDLGKDDEKYLGIGWNNKEDDGRWAWKRSSVMFKVVSPRKFTLRFQAKAYYKNMPTDIYIDKKKIASISIPLEGKEFQIPIDLTLNKGIHTVYFFFQKSYYPSKITNSTDNRQLSAKFTNISLIPMK